MKYILSLIISGALVVSGFGQTRNVLVGTNNAVVQPTNFWSADASNARTGLGLGTAATSSVSAFQPSSSTLSNLATGNGGALSNLQATNLVGIIPASNISTVTFTNIGGTLAISSGGTGATNAVNARQNLGSTIVGDAVFIATNAAAARTAIGALATDGNAINLTNFPSTLLRINGNGAGLTNLTAESITGAVSIAKGGTGATNAATARSGLGLGWSALTNINSTNFRTDIGLGSEGSVVFSNLSLSNGTATNPALAIGSANRGFFATSGPERIGVAVGGSNVASFFSTQFEVSTSLATASNATVSGNLILGGPVSFIGAEISANIATTRTNLGLGATWLTNTNTAGFNTSLYGSGTNPVLYNTNGEVVSPTNFWAVAPISTTVQYQTNVTGTSTNAATNSRNLFLFSLSPSVGVTNVTNIVTLPTNPATTFEGDRATITHLANSTNAVTAIRQLGAATNLITLNQLDETVLLMYRSGAWRLADNISYIEPIYFSGTNAAANAAASRTNLGLGENAIVKFEEINAKLYAGSGTNIVFSSAIFFDDIDSQNIVEQTRTNLGIPLPALTNTNNANFRNAIELGATNNVSFSNVTASGTLTATGTVTATTNLVVNGFVDFSTNHTNSNPATSNQINDFIEIRVGTNQFWLPVYK
jgi:hypothetical protein